MNEDKLDQDQLKTDNEPREEVVERIEKASIKPLNNPKCKHQFVKEDDFETEFWYSVHCKFCPVGHLVRK